MSASQTADATIIVAIKHIYCCEKSQYSKYVIPVSKLSREDMDLIRNYEGDYFMEDCAEIFARVSDVKEIWIDENGYSSIEIQHTHVHC